jgi:hypothetical protein
MFDFRSHAQLHAVLLATSALALGIAVYLFIRGTQDLAIGTIIDLPAYPSRFGGSRADGTVELAFDYGQMENVTIDWAPADNEAKQKCKAWGYEAAERFGAVKQQCVGGFNNLGCVRTQVTATYQCLGKGDAKL